MNNNEKSAAADEFVAPTKDKSIQQIVIHGDLVNVPSVASPLASFFGVNTNTLP